MSQFNKIHQYLCACSYFSVYKQKETLLMQVYVDVCDEKIIY